MASIPVTLTDGGGYTWDFVSDGSVATGSNGAFDGAFDLFYMPNVATADMAEAGREYTISGRVLGLNIDLTRSFYVPLDQSWARFIDTATNTGVSAQTFTFSVRTDLGANLDTEVLSTDTGDLLYDLNDRWLVTDDSGGPDPVIGIALGDGTLDPTLAYLFSDDVIFEYEVTLQPGESASILYFGTQGSDQATVEATVQGLASALSGDMLTGLSPEEQARIINYTEGLVPPEPIIGSNGADILTGSSDSETIDGLDGNDVLRGADGIDTIRGGGGNDLLEGGAGGDRLEGGDGDDILLGGEGIDTLLGEAGTDILVGGAGADDLRGGRGDDRLIGGLGDDSIDGGGEDDFLVGEGGADILRGGDGNDFLFGGGGNDTLEGGAGSDWASFADATASVSVNLSTQSVTGGTAGTDTISSIENVVASAFDDVLTGNSADNWFRPGDGDDQIIGGSGVNGVDYTDATAGVILTIGAGASTQNTIGAGVDSLSDIQMAIGSPFDDALTAALGNLGLWGGAGDDALLGNAENNTFYGEEGADTLDGLDGDDSLDGGSGNDTLSGGVGFDVLIGGEGDDTLSGGDLSDTLDGGDGNDTIFGDRGWDFIEGGAGNDIIDGGSGPDTINGGAGDDTITGGGENDVITGGDGNDSLNGGWNADVLRGGAGNDVLVGDQGDDILEGGTGNDNIYSGTGADVFVFAEGSGFDTAHGFDVAFDTLDVSGHDVRDKAELDSMRIDMGWGQRIVFSDGSFVNLAGLSEADYDAMSVIYV